METDEMRVNRIVEQRVKDELARIECSFTDTGWGQLAREINAYVHAQGLMYGNPTSTKIRNDIYNLIKYVVGVNSIMFIQEKSDVEKARKIFELVKELKPLSGHRSSPNDLGIYRVTYRDESGRRFAKAYSDKQKMMKDFMHLSEGFIAVNIELL